MVSIFFTIMILLAVNFGNGIIVRGIFKIRNSSFALNSLLGIMGISILEVTTAFFYPLNYVVEVSFIAVGLIGVFWFLKKEKRFQFNLKYDFWFWFFLFVIIFSASFSPYLFDHYGYYVPTISYLNEVGFVKGISNLDLLLGQTSFWHIYQAGMSHFTDPFFKINSYLLFLFLIYVYERKQYFLFIFIPFFLLFVQQPSPDLPVLIMTLIVINELIRKRGDSVILCLSLFAFCIKPIVFWLPLMVILNNFNQKKFDFRIIMPASIFGILLMVKNLWLFGFPVFPVSFPDIDLAWKPSQEMLTYSSQIGLMKSYDMKYSYQQILGFSFFDKLYHWFTIGYKSILNASIIVSLFVISAYAFKKNNRFYYLLLVCLILKLVLIISFSAQYRFFIDVYLIAVLLLVKSFSEQKAIFSAVILSVFLSVIFVFPGFVKQFNLRNKMAGFTWFQLYKPEVNSKINIFSEHKIGNFNFKVPENPLMKEGFPVLNIYDLKLYDYYGIFPQQIGKDSENGFFQRKLTAKEKAELKKIIAETDNHKPKVP